MALPELHYSFLVEGKVYTSDDRRDGHRDWPCQICAERLLAATPPDDGSTLSIVAGPDHQRLDRAEVLDYIAPD